MSLCCPDIKSAIKSSLWKKSLESNREKIHPPDNCLATAEHRGHSEDMRQEIIDLIKKSVK